MKRVRLFLTAVLGVVVAVPLAQGQEGPKPGPEHDELKKLVGTWDLTMKFGGMETKGTATYKMDLGGLWLASTVDSEIFGSKFSGKGYDTYDLAKKKYVGIWIDSMSTSPMIMEGTLDKATKTMTMTGVGPGEDGKPTKYRSVSAMPDENTINFKMYTGDGTEPAFTIVYKRRK